MSEDRDMIREDDEAVREAVREEGDDVEAHSVREAVREEGDSAVREAVREEGDSAVRES